LDIRDVLWRINRELGVHVGIENFPGHGARDRTINQIVEVTIRVWSGNSIPPLPQ
jgi:hypothetical protein